MTDLVHVLPDFDTGPYAHILPSLERALITSNDLLTLDALDIAKRAQVPWPEVDKLARALVDALHDSIEPRQSATQEQPKENRISVLNEQLNEALGGGIPTGHLTEIVGESAAGKTQFLLSLLLAVQLPAPHGLDKSALYITTEGPLHTARLAQILTNNPTIGQYDPAHHPSLSRIQSIKVNDLETQDHVLRFQVPVAITRSNIGLLVIDSIAANYRAEFTSNHKLSSTPGAASRIQALHDRSQKLIQTGLWLRHLARDYNIAVVVANQVLDRFTVLPPIAAAHPHGSQPSQSQQQQPYTISSSAATSHQSDTDPTLPDPRPEITLSTDDPLALDHQQRFFTGWGDVPHVLSDEKTPSLGMTWTNQLSARIVLQKRLVHAQHVAVTASSSPPPLSGGSLDGSGPMRWERTMKVAFASWCTDGNGLQGTGFEISKGGVTYPPTST